MHPLGRIEVRSQRHDEDADPVSGRNYSVPAQTGIENTIEIIAIRTGASDVIDDAKMRAAATYNAAADSFDAPALSFWDRLARRTVERISLQRGEAVLDACCGAGASAIAAAEAVGPNGRVLGVDFWRRIF